MTLTYFGADTSIICGNHDHRQFECVDCGLSIMECDCVNNGELDGGDVYCHDCQVTYWTDYDALCGLERAEEAKAEDDDWDSEKFWEEFEAGTSVDDTVNGTVGAYWAKCRHNDHEVILPEGTKVYASSERTRKDMAQTPDLGIYMDSLWSPQCPAFFVDWIDYGLPEDYESTVKVILEGWHRAKDEYWVEIGCIGGHGRTGSVLACMALLDSDGAMTAAEAIKWVRTTYCEFAVEGPEQEWWISWFNALIFGGTPDPIMRTLKDDEGKIIKDHNGKATRYAEEYGHSYDAIGSDWSMWDRKQKPPTDGGIIWDHDWYSDQKADPTLNTAAQESNMATGSATVTEMQEAYGEDDAYDDEPF